MAPTVKQKRASLGPIPRSKDRIQKIDYMFNKPHCDEHRVVIKIHAKGPWHLQEPGSKVPTPMGRGEFVLDFTTNSHTLESMTILIIDPDPGRRKG